MRVINVALKIAPDMTAFFKSLDCDAVSYYFARSSVDKCSQKPEAESTENVLKLIYKLFRYYRYDVGGRYESREFALPDKLKYFPLYLSSFLSKACFNPKIQTSNEDLNFYSIIELSQLSLSRFVFFMYPKIFDLAKLFVDS